MLLTRLFTGVARRVVHRGTACAINPADGQTWDMSNRRIHQRQFQFPEKPIITVVILERDKPLFNTP
jgi:hypothetical protein